MPAEPVAAPDHFTEEVREYLRERIHGIHPITEANKFYENDLNHMRRFVTSLQWIPDRPGRVIDPAPGAEALFPMLLRHFREADVVLPAFFNLEKEPAPYADASFDGVVLMEVLEHFTVDPMFAMGELNRILKPGGFLFLTTPNLASWVSLHNLINHHTPYIYGLYDRNPTPDRHNREYTWLEVGWLAEAAGFRVERLEAITVYPDHDVVGPTPGVTTYNRGDTTFLLARKEGPVRDRYPAWLYMNWQS
jgi:SAM-dependent methyltransferase